MPATAIAGLSVTYGTSFGRSDVHDDGRPAWRILVGSAEAVFPMMFARRIDAEAAMRAVADFTDWTQVTAENVNELDVKELRRRLVSAMAW